MTPSAEEYEKIVLEIYKKSFLQLIERHKELTSHLNIGDMVKSHGKLYTILSIQHDYTMYPEGHKFFSFYSCPEIRIFGTPYYHNKKKGTGFKYIMNLFSIGEATADDFSKIKKVYTDRVNKQRKSKRDSDPLFKMTCSLRSRVRLAFKANGWKKKDKSIELLGVEFNIAKSHLERTFKRGMNWGNHGKLWEIDHIIPMASAKTEEDLKILCHYTNLQALWKSENHKKAAKIPQVQVKLTL